LAWKAFATHPLIDSVNIGKELLRAYIAEIPAIAKVFEK
jgi:6-phospho-beta-glucosidase